MAVVRWLSAGLFAAAALAVLVIGLSGSGNAASSSRSVEAANSERGANSAAATIQDRSSAATDSGDSGYITSSAVGSANAVDSTAGSLPTGPAAQSAQSVPIGSDVQLRIPSLGVDAAVAPLGFDAAGGFAVPDTAAAVGWYEFSAWPGAPGNSVLGGHLNWRGDRGVFGRLEELSPGDLIYVDTVDGEVAFEVTRLFMVTAQTPFADILGERSGPSTLTLFTCGGTFSTAAGEYDQRTVVTAERVEA